jgi:hypothetical protein
MIVELPNGQELEFPDDTPQDVMRQAIHKHFPEYAPKPVQSLGEKLGSALKRGAADVGVGASELVRNVINAPHNLLWSGFPKQEQPDYQAAFGAPREEEKTLADKLLQFTPELATAIALPAASLGTAGRAIESIPKAGKYLKTALGNALSQGGFAATQVPENAEEAGLTAGAIAGPFTALAQGAREGSPLTRLLSKGLIGTGIGTGAFLGAKEAGFGNLGAGLTGLGGGLLAAKYGLNPSRIAKETALEGVTPANSMEALEAAKRLGLKYITPAEASNLAPVGAMQGGLGKTPGAAPILYKAGMDRLSTEKTAIENLFKTIFNEKELAPRVEDLYSIARPKAVPAEDLSKLKDNEVFKRALKMVENKTAYKESLKGVPKNSVDYLDHVKQAMDDLIEKAPKKEGRIIKKAKKELVEVADKAAPEYKEARGLAERQITRQKLEEFFDKRKITGSNFAKFLESGKNYNKLQHNLRNIPEAQKMAEDMRLIFPRLINIQNAKGAEASSRTSMSKSRDLSDYAIRQLKEALSLGSYDRNATKLITNPKWIDELIKMQKNSRSQKSFGRIADILGKGGGQSVAQ